MNAVSRPDALYALAADVGGTMMRAAVVSAEAEVVASESRPTEPDRDIEDAAKRLAGIIGIVHERAGSPPVVGLGVATAGPIDPDTGVYDNPPNMMGWTGKSLKPGLVRALNLPVHVGHDATLAALAETTCGPHNGARNLIYVTVSTGIGGRDSHERPDSYWRQRGRWRGRPSHHSTGRGNVRTGRPQHPGRQRLGHRHRENRRRKGGRGQRARLAGSRGRGCLCNNQPYGI